MGMDQNHISTLKPYQTIPIRESREPLIPIPLDLFQVESPHPYQKLGADYGGKSPYYLRQGVVEALNVAQQQLQKRQPGWSFHLFDAYRPIAVQQFMVDYTFRSCLTAQGLNNHNLPAEIEKQIYRQVYQFWAPPSSDPTTPPPHSTGGAVDLTLVDASGKLVDMGGAIDEISPRSHPSYYAQSSQSREIAYHQHRELLREVMYLTGFQRHPGEWWHFCLGEQMWAWLSHKDYAYYGGI